MNGSIIRQKMVQGHLPKHRVCEIFLSTGNVQKHNDKTISEACGNT